MAMTGYLCAGAIIIIILLGCAGIACASANPDQKDAAFWAPAEKALGVKGEYNPDGTATFDVPRNLTVTLDGIRLAPGSDLSHEIRMQRVGDKVMVVGELVLTEDEVGSATASLLRAGINETALHNHILHESPPLMYLHFHAYGNLTDISAAIGNITNSLGVGPEGKFDGRGIDTARLDQILGRSGRTDGGVYGFSIPRADHISMNGMVLAPSMDISTEISFQPLGSGDALAIGEYVLKADEVEPVTRTLSDNGIEVDALHSHMLTEQPRLLYLHCWATGNAEQLARRLKGALDKTNSAGPEAINV